MGIENNFLVKCRLFSGSIFELLQTINPYVHKNAKKRFQRPLSLNNLLLGGQVKKILGPGTAISAREFVHTQKSSLLLLSFTLPEQFCINMKWFRSKSQPLPRPPPNYSEKEMVLNQSLLGPLVEG